MKAEYKQFLGFIKEINRFSLPIYQRKYSWKQAQCEQLWHDIFKAGQAETSNKHFIGSIVYVADNESHESASLVIDGQQRLTTITIILTAIRDIVGDQEPIEGFSKEKINEYYLINRLEKNEKYRKLRLTETDRETLYSLIDNRDFPEKESERIVTNYNYFKNLIEKQSHDPNFLRIICKGLQNLFVVYIALERSKDNPQLIFESMNSTGLELSQTDLIRNYVLMDLDEKLQNDLYNYYWKPMEESFGQGDDREFDSFMRHFLTVKTGIIPNINKVYVEFKHFSGNKFSKKELNVKDLITELKKYSRYYCAIAMGQESDLELLSAFHDISELNATVTYPFLLELYADYDAGKLSREDFLDILCLVESYVFRRAVCDIPTNSLNKTFANFMKDIDKNHYLESVGAQFLLLTTYKRFPLNQEFEERIKNRDLYSGLRRAKYTLRKIENFDRKEGVEINEFTIEHIMPQTLSPEWKKALGNDWEDIHEKYLHTLGNLTLTGYNSEYSNRPFIEKQKMKGGFEQSPLKLNEGLRHLDTWGEPNIKSRSDILAKQAREIWKIPVISEEILQRYKPVKDSSSEYSREDHQYLKVPIVGNLFDALGKEILNLDDNVTEVYLKNYIAYKAETNFVDLVPQAKAISVSLNIEFTKLNDPKHLCRDISGKGRLGIGLCECKISSQEEIPYIIGLIRQALECQIDGD